MVIIRFNLEIASDPAWMINMFALGDTAAIIIAVSAGGLTLSAHDCKPSCQSCSF